MNYYQDNILFRNMELFGSGKLPNKSIKYKNSDIDYPSLITIMEKDKEKPLQTRSIKLYINRLANLWRDVFNKPFGIENLDLIEKKEEITKYLHALDNDNKRTNMISSIMAFFKRTPTPTNIKIIEYYSELLKDFEKIRKINVRENKSENKNEKDIYDNTDWNELQDIVRKINPDMGKLALSDKTILSLYLFAPAPRRLLDYTILKVKKVQNPNKLKIEKTDKGNYVISTLDNIAKKIVLNTYKTSSTYGQYSFTPNKELVKSLKPMLQNRESNQYLLQQANGKPYTVNTFTTVVKQATSRRFNKPLTVNHLRHIFATKIWNDTDKLNLNELNDKAVDMGHSLTTNLEYRKIE